MPTIWLPSKWTSSTNRTKTWSWRWKNKSPSPKTSPKTSCKRRSWARTTTMRSTRTSCSSLREGFYSYVNYSISFFEYKGCTPSSKRGTNWGRKSNSRTCTWSSSRRIKGSTSKKYQKRPTRESKIWILMASKSPRTSKKTPSWRVSAWYFCLLSTC